MDIAALIARPEGKTLEFKRDLSGTRNVLRTLCAFANTAGGTLVFGVEDSGALSGVSDVLAFEQQLASVSATESLRASSPRSMSSRGAASSLSP